jgi:hypothetical protein
MKLHMTDVVVSRLTRGAYYDQTTPAFGLRVGKNQNRICDARTPIADLTAQPHHVRFALQSGL